MGILLFLILLMTYFILGVPVAFAIGLVPITLMMLQGSLGNFSIIAQRTLYGIDSFVLIAIPFFLFTGRIMNSGGITKRIFKFARSLVGHFKGGLGHVNIIASLIFSGITGTASSDVAGLGAVEIKAMEDAGYESGVAAAITAASATVGPIIPPSIPLVIYGVLAGVSVGRLMIGGIIPGILTGLVLMIMVSYYAHTRDYPRDVKMSFKEILQSFIEAFSALLTPVILIGGIFSGQFTPTEAAAVAALYSVIISLILGEVSIKEIWQCAKGSAVDSAVIGIIVSSAALFGWLLIRLRIPIVILEFLTTFSDSKFVILLLLNVFLLFIGCFLETVAALTILVPILAPILPTIGIDPLHFGLIMVFNLMIGLLTPPFGLNLYILNKITNIPLEKLVKYLIPWLLALLFILIILNLFPGIVTFLPTFFMG